MAEDPRGRIRSQHTIGIISTVVDSAVAEIAAGLGFDFYVGDLEHGLSSDAQCVPFIRTCQATGMIPLFRVPSTESARMTRLLDAGAQGVLVPRVRTRGQIEGLCSELSFPPGGSRGLSAVHISRQGLAAIDAEFLRVQERSIIIGAQIEDATGLENLDQIASVERLDMLMVGTTDLAISIGSPGEYDHQFVRDALDAVDSAAKKHGRSIGVVARSPERASALATTPGTAVFIGLSQLMRYGAMSYSTNAD